MNIETVRDITIILACMITLLLGCLLYLKYQRTKLQKKKVVLCRLFQSGAYQFARRLYQAGIGATVIGDVRGIKLKARVLGTGSFSLPIETEVHDDEGFEYSGATLAVRRENKWNGVNTEADFFLHKYADYDEVGYVIRMVEAALDMIRQDGIDLRDELYDYPPNNGSDGPGGSIPASV